MDITSKLMSKTVGYLLTKLLTVDEKRICFEKKGFSREKRSKCQASQHFLYTVTFR